MYIGFSDSLTSRHHQTQTCLFSAKSLHQVIQIMPGTKAAASTDVVMDKHSHVTVHLWFLIPDFSQVSKIPVISESNPLHENSPQDKSPRRVI